MQRQGPLHRHQSAARDAASFQAFYKKYSGLIFASISNVLNDHHDTEDVMQEVLVQVWNKAHLYEPRKGKPLTWLTTMARNRAIDRVRMRRRRAEPPLEAHDLPRREHLRVLVAAGPSPARRPADVGPRGVAEVLAQVVGEIAHERILFARLRPRRGSS